MKNASPISRLSTSLPPAGAGRLRRPSRRLQRGDPASIGRVARGLLGGAASLRWLRHDAVHGEWTRQLVELGVDGALWIASVLALLGFLAAYLLLNGSYAAFYGVYVPTLVGHWFIGYVAPLMVAFLVIGHGLVRMTTELASMGADQEIDALEALGIDPVAYLVLPRALALTLATPALTLAGIFAADAGGVAAAFFYRRDVSGVFFDGFLRAADGFALPALLLKQGLAGAAMSCLGGYFGLRVREEIGGAGHAATGAVCWSVLAVLALEVVFAVLG